MAKFLRIFASFALACVAAPQMAASGGITHDPTDKDMPKLEFLFEEIVTLGPVVQMGDTSTGGRTIIPITGGQFEGPKLRGAVMPGGWDWQLHRPDGCTVIEADYFLRTDDGVVINILNKGIACPPNANPEGTPMRTVAVFEAPKGKYDWMNKAAFVGVLALHESPDKSPAVKIRIYRLI